MILTGRDVVVNIDGVELSVMGDSHPIKPLTRDDGWAEYKSGNRSIDCSLSFNCSRFSDRIYELKGLADSGMCIEHIQYGVHTMCRVDDYEADAFGTTFSMTPLSRWTFVVRRTKGKRPRSILVKEYMPL